MIKLYICCLVLIIGSVEVGLDIDMKFHQEVMEIGSYDNTIMNNFILKCKNYCILRFQNMAITLGYGCFMYIVILTIRYQQFGNNNA